MAAETEADSVGEKQLSGAVPTIHLTPDQARSKWHYWSDIYVVFIHLQTHTEAQNRPLGNHMGWDKAMAI